MSESPPTTPPAPPSYKLDALPALRTPLSVPQIAERLAAASKRGRMSGLDRKPVDGAPFSLTLFGAPFDYRLTPGSIETADGRTLIRWRARMLPKMPAIFAGVIAFTIWPGVWLTDRLIPGEWGWIPTWWWYLPLTVLPLPWAVASLLKKSRAAAEQHAFETLNKIAAEAEGELEASRT